MSKPARFIAAGFGSGWAPKAPGTAGSLVGLAIGLPLLAVSPWAVLAGATIATLAGFWSIRAATGLAFREPAAGTHDDPGWIVIDEIAGQLVALLALTRPSPAGAALAFALFRLLDIAKPGPVGWLDRQGGAWGIMADDVAAGILAGSLLLCIRLAFPAPFWVG